MKKLVLSSLAVLLMVGGCIKPNSDTDSDEPKEIEVEEETEIEIEENESILATDNCLIVVLDTTVINPYYVAAYLNSEKGRNSLDRISVGTAIKTISVSELKEMLIPCPSLQEQKEIAEKYEDYIKELHLLKIREAELQDSLANVFFGED